MCCYSSFLLFTGATICELWNENRIKDEFIFTHIPVGISLSRFTTLEMEAVSPLLGLSFEYPAIIMHFSIPFYVLAIANIINTHPILDYPLVHGAVV